MIAPARSCRILLPVWGTARLRQFLALCLPTLLANGNIPALARHLPTRLVLLTRAREMALLQADPAWQELGKCCDSEIALIDDLVVDGNPHAALTLAYLRGIRAAGEAITDTVFVFLVADYLVADGALAAVMSRIENGASAVLAGSLQVTAEAAMPLLGSMPRGARSEFAIAPRQLVALALAHLHPSSAARMVEGSILHDADTNRLFWRVDEKTLLGRFYLLHMIAVRPQVKDFVVSAPCDYSFIPELTPTGRVDIVADSDEYLAVEMETRPTLSFQESISAPVGPITAKQLARSLSRWTTSGHRRNAQALLVFHAGDRPSRLSEVEAGSARFVAEVDKHLSRSPQPHRGHPTWTGMMALQRSASQPQEAAREWARLTGAPLGSGGLTGLLWRSRLAVLGDPPNVSPCHARWPEYRAIRRLLREQMTHAARLLVVGAKAQRFASWAAPLCGSADALAWEELPLADDLQHYDGCLCLIEEPIREAAIEAVTALLRPGAVILCVAGDSPDMALRQLHSACDIESAHYVPLGPVRNALAGAIARAIRAARGARAFTLVLFGGSTAVLALGVLLVNLVIAVCPSSMLPRGRCSTVLLVARRRTPGSSCAGHRASKTRVNALVSRASTSFWNEIRDADGRDEPGHDVGYIRSCRGADRQKIEA